jgi:hypothetical protein
MIDNTEPRERTRAAAGGEEHTMVKRNYNLISLLSLTFVMSFLFASNQTIEVDNKYDLFITEYNDEQVNDIITSKTASEIISIEFLNKRYETDRLTYYYGQLTSDAYFDDHLFNIISGERKELWGVLQRFEKYERYDIDSNQIFHEVIIDDILIGYYLKDSIPNAEINRRFNEFLKIEFQFHATNTFPSNIFE